MLSGTLTPCRGNGAELRGTSSENADSRVRLFQGDGDDRDAVANLGSVKPTVLGCDAWGLGGSVRQGDGSTSVSGPTPHLLGSPPTGVLFKMLRSDALVSL